MQELVDKFRGYEYVINNDIYVLIDIISDKVYLASESTDSIVHIPVYDFNF
nr:hypothetical protein DGKKSRWO_DGKKSRWO_CDS_0143 [uncultured phage]CAI9752320.1 hypothetical protein CVNMHQAP_CVNMHQAP_CDS_0143 [uncultured phage]